MTVKASAGSTIARPPRYTDIETNWEPRLPTILAMLVGFAVIWAVYLTVTEAPDAIKHDMAEAYAWGQEFQLGYNQHPPFWAWICGAWFWELPRTGWAFALLSSLNAGIGLWGAWRLIGDFSRGSERVAAWMLLLLTPLYTFYAYKYNANVIFLSIWPWTQHYFMKSVRDRCPGDAIGFGIWLGLALMSKYYALILVATCFLAVLWHPARRKYLTSASPWISAAVTAVICAPHAWWLLNNRAPPIHYLESISGQQWFGVIDYAGKTLGGALGMNLGVALVVGLAVWLARRDQTNRAIPDSRTPRRAMLVTLTLAPLVMTIIAGLALRTRTTAEMTVGTFALLPLLIIDLADLRDTARLRRIATRLAVVLTFGALILSPAIALTRTYLSSTAMRVEPFQEAAAEATNLWHAQTGLPLMYVGGSAWYENAIAFYSTDRPHVFVYFDFARNLWVTRADLAKHGLLSMCVATDQNCLAETAPFVTPETTRTSVSLARAFWGHVARPVHFVVTIIPPHA